MERMTKTTIANLKVADCIGFDSVPDVPDAPGAVMVYVERNGNRAYVSGSTGPLVYENSEKARRNLKRIRPDLEPTWI